MNIDLQRKLEIEQGLVDNLGQKKCPFCGISYWECSCDWKINGGVNESKINLGEDK